VSHAHGSTLHHANIFGRGVGGHGESRAPGRKRIQFKPARYHGVDEKAFREGHDYMSVICELIGSPVEYVAEERKAKDLEGHNSSSLRIN
jgi:hypothetical protein